MRDDGNLDLGGNNGGGEVIGSQICTLKVEELEG